MKRIRIAAIGFMILFAVLMAVRMDIPAQFFTNAENTEKITTDAIPETDTWKNLYLNDHKIGYAHSVLAKQKSGFRLDETLFMRMNVMGFSQDIRMSTTADLNPDLSLSSFDFKLHSGLFEFAAIGKLQPENILSVKITSSGSEQTAKIQLDHPPHLSSGILYAAARDFKHSKKDAFKFHIFDPSTMSQEAVIINVLGDEEITHMGQLKKTTKLTINYKGTAQTAWMDEHGEFLKETGLLGMSLEKTTKKDALAEISGTPVEDITEIASVPVNIKIASPRKSSILKIKLSGINTDTLYLNGGRQTLDGNILTITKEKLADYTNPDGTKPDETKPDEAISIDALTPFLSPEPFIESDHPDIVKLTETIVSSDDPPLKNGQRLVEWVYKNIEKRPVLSIPDALSTLKNRVGDCNEHAVLLAALTRSAGIPSKIESGLVYLRGRFYYHAWNLLYVGKWITADSVFGQLPADATHIRFASGNPESQLDLIPVIDHVGIAIIESED